MAPRGKLDNKVTEPTNAPRPRVGTTRAGESSLTPLRGQVVKATTTQRSWPVRAAFWLSDKWIDVFIVGGALLGGLGQLLSRDIVATTVAGWPLLVNKATKEGVQEIGAVLTALGVLIALFGAWGQTRRKTRVSALEDQVEIAQNEIEKLEDEKGELVAGARQLLLRYLTVLGTGQLALTHSDRITLYIHDGDVGFTRAARFSPNPNFSKSGRVFYPDHEGCIGKAWDQGVFFADDYPDPDTEKDAYFARCVEDGMAAKVAKSIRMRSRTYAAYTIKDVKGHQSLAVVVVESLEAGRFTREELDAIFDGAEPARYLGEFLEVFARELPDITNAQKEGF